MDIASEPRRQIDSTSSLIMTAIAVVILLLGAGALAIVVSNAAAVINAGGETGVMILSFLDTYGIILPLLLIGFGIALVRLSVGLFRHERDAGAWAQQIFLWLGILAFVLTLQGFGAGLSQPDTGGLGLALSNALLYAIGTVIAAASFWWLSQNIKLYVGHPKLTEASTRTAWNLLVPTLIVLVVVALRPLEKTFIASLTNERFASSQAVAFVGFDNYAQLLGFRFDSIGCTTDDSGACTVDESGARVFPRPRDVLDSGYRDLRFRELATLDVGSSRILLSVRDPDFFRSLGNTLVFTVGSVTLELILGLFIAMVVNSKFSGRGLMRAAMLVPWAIPTVVSARLWQIMFRDNQSGLFNRVLTLLGSSQSVAWLANPDYQLLALIAVDVWKTTPFMALVLLAGLQTISGEVYEAADVDGATGATKFFRITLPLLRPTIAVALVFRTLDAVRVFDVFQVLLGRQQLSMATYNYETLVNNQALGYASAVGVLIFIIILISTVIYVRLLGVSAE